jgi:hypothetical protein
MRRGWESDGFVKAARYRETLRTNQLVSRGAFSSLEKHLRRSFSRHLVADYDLFFWL